MTKNVDRGSVYFGIAATAFFVSELISSAHRCEHQAMLDPESLRFVER